MRELPVFELTDEIEGETAMIEIKPEHPIEPPPIPRRVPPTE